MALQTQRIVYLLSTKLVLSLEVSRLLFSRFVGVLIAMIVPVNLKTEDKFHLTIEEYLHAVISLVEELVYTPFIWRFLCCGSFYLTLQ